MFPLSCAHELPLINTGSPTQQQSGVTQGFAQPSARFKTTAVLFCSGYELLYSVGGGGIRGNIVHDL